MSPKVAAYLSLAMMVTAVPLKADTVRALLTAMLLIRKQDPSIGTEILDLIRTNFPKDLDPEADTYAVVCYLLGYDLDTTTNLTNQLLM